MLTLEQQDLKQSYVQLLKTMKKLLMNVLLTIKHSRCPTLMSRYLKVLEEKPMFMILKDAMTILIGFLIYSRLQSHHVCIL